MQIELVPVIEEQREILAHLIELYEYDFSEYENSDVNSYGLYGYSYLDYYWTEKNRYAYFIKVDGKLAGFVMICGFCYVSKTKDTLFMSEFFVMKKYRKMGVGFFAACEALKKHPGKWELTVHTNNPISHCFWKKVVETVSHDSFQIIEEVEGVYDDALATAYVFEVIPMTIDRFWQDFLEKTGKSADTTYLECFHFELTEKWANELLRLVLIGQKRATASSLKAFEIQGERTPQKGDYSIVTDWDGNPRCVIETTNVTILPFNEITYDICKREGEDDNLESWRKGHTNFFTNEGKELGYEFSEDMLVVFEDFEVVYTEAL